MSKMTDVAVRAELERIDDPEQTLLWLFKITGAIEHQKGKNPTAITFATIKALRFLAGTSLRDRESQQALGEIIPLAKKIKENDEDSDSYEIHCNADFIVEIASTAWKGK